MNVLAVDTSTLQGSIAIVNRRKVLFEYTFCDKESYSKKLLFQIDEGFKQSSLTINDIDGFAVCHGPGSFTGIRIGIAIIYGLSMAIRKPIVEVSSLVALIETYSSIEGLICPLIDARKNEVYTALYRRQNNQLEQIADEFVVDPQSLCSRIKEPVSFIGEDAVLFKDFFKKNLKKEAMFPSSTLAKSTAASIAFLGGEKLITMTYKSGETISPNYIRRSDAEISWKKKQHKDDDTAC